MNRRTSLWLVSVLATGTQFCALPWLLERLMPGPDVVFDDWLCAVARAIVPIAPYVGSAVVILGTGTSVMRRRLTRPVHVLRSVGNKEISDAPV